MLTSETVTASAAGDWLTRKKAAMLLAALGCPISWRTLQKWGEDDNSGNGPPYTRTRRKIIRYHRNDIIEWVKREARRVK
jgi:hypothetical protein